MRNSEQRGLDETLSIEQNIQINGAGGVSKHRVTAEAPFRFLANGQHVFRPELCLQTNDTVIKPHVVVTMIHIDWFGLVIRREASQRGMREKPHQGNGAVTKVLPVPLVRSEGKKDGFGAHDSRERPLWSPPDLFEAIDGFG